MYKLAIMGGTFDPIHMGHLRMAETVRQEFDFSRLVLLPAYRPPHKQRRCDFADPADRLEMARLAVEDYPYLTVSDLEFHRRGLSYTFDTVCRLESLWPDCSFYMVIGADMVEQLPTWYKSHELLQRIHFLAVERPGYSAEKGVRMVEKAFGGWAAAKIIPAPMPEMDVSSTEIRARVRKGLSIHGLVPDAVEDYIIKHRLYRACDTADFDWKR